MDMPLATPIDPVAAVRRTTAEVMNRAVHVSLSQAAVEQVATWWATNGMGQVGVKLNSNPSSGLAPYEKGSIWSIANALLL